MIRSDAGKSLTQSDTTAEVGRADAVDRRSRRGSSLTTGPIRRELPSAYPRVSREEIEAAMEALEERRTTCDRVLDHVVDRLLEEIS